MTKKFNNILKFMMETFCIKWDSFKENVTRSYSQLRNEKKFSDVTLVSDDHQLVSAHKVVLSTCSKYLNDILKQDHSGNIFLCLEGVGLNDLNNLPYLPWRADNLP